ncbi:hypothetical protein K3495_g1336 [Podosphaera aphanis]|nr:hypothetical protein K3495_g1336 [Podosphaera aphanis]
MGISNVDEKMGEKIITEQNSHPKSPETTDKFSELQNLEQQGHNTQYLILNELSPQHSVTSTPNTPILKSSSTGVSFDSSSAINLNLSNTKAPSSQFLQNTFSPLEKHHVSELKKLKRKIDDDDINSDHESKRVRALIAALISQLTPNYGVECDAAMNVGEKAINITIPRSYKEAINDPIHSEEWRDAITEETNSLKANGTWKEEITPKDVNLVSKKWVFTIKTNPDGSLERYKARLVARGFSQIYGHDCTEIFAPTVRMDTLRVFLAIFAAENLECRHGQYDIKNAFKEATLKERIYLSPPAGVPVKDGVTPVDLDKSKTRQ